jgi:hypothetical protein
LGNIDVTCFNVNGRKEKGMSGMMTGQTKLMVEEYLRREGKVYER